MSSRQTTVLELYDDDYELGLIIFETYHMIPNMNESNNKFYFSKDDVEIPKDSYEMWDINEFLKFRAILRKRPRRDALEIIDVVRGDNSNNDIDDDGEGGKYDNASQTTTRWNAKLDAPKINFDSIESLLGFLSKHILQSWRWHESNLSINIMNVNIIRVNRNVTAGAYSNGKDAHNKRIFAQHADEI